MHRYSNHEAATSIALAHKIADEWIMLGFNEPREIDSDDYSVDGVPASLEETVFLVDDISEIWHQRFHSNDDYYDQCKLYRPDV